MINTTFKKIEEQEIENIRLSKGKILAVDDDPVALGILKAMLEAANMEVTTAINGRLALTILKDKGDYFDTILLDKHMPEMSGLELVEQLNKHPSLRSIPIVMQTGDNNPEEILEGIDAGCFYYLTKPLQQDSLTHVVRAAIEENRTNQVLKRLLKQYDKSFGNVINMDIEFQNFEEAEMAASMLANFFPDKDKAICGLTELFYNAIEHGNLGIGYEKKTELRHKNIWRQEISRLIDLPANKDKKVKVNFKREETKNGPQGVVTIIDEGEGFNSSEYLFIDVARAKDSHGRGIAMAKLISFDNLIYNKKGNQVTAISKLN